MKFNYFGYSVSHQPTDRQFLIDLRGFFRAFARHSNLAFKNLFYYNGEKVYLIHIRDDFYLFVQTKSQELIKKIDSATINVTAIETLLAADENIGFASYVSIGKKYLAFGYKLLSPRATCFTSFVNSIWTRLGLDDFRFKLTALTSSATVAEALTYGFYGSTHIQVAKNHGVVDSLMRYFGANVNDFSDLDSVEIIFKPKPKGDMSRAAKKVIQSIDLDGVDKFTVRAKVHARDHLMDLHLEGEGQIFDRIDRNDEFEVLDILQDRMANNQDLKEKVREHEEDTAFDKTDPNIFADWDTSDHWSNMLDGVQVR